MKFLRRWLWITALVAASVWVYLFTAATLQLGTLTDSVARTTVTQSATGREPHAGAAERRAPRMAAADPEPSAARDAATEFDAQPAPSDDLGSAQMLRLLADELRTETDPEAADAFLREFEETLDTP